MAARVLRIGFHWITVLLVTAAFAIAFWRGGLDDPDGGVLDGAPAAPWMRLAPWLR